MAFDGAYLYTIRSELMQYIGARVDKIHQPSRDEVILHLRSREGTARLLISTAGDSARLHLTTVSIENPAVPPMFCMLLRKHLGGGKLLDVRQEGLDRILFLAFECMNELGDRVQLTLACEVMGRYSNLVLIGDDGKVIDSLRRNADVTRERVLLPGFPYEMPHRTGRLNFLEADDDTIVNALLLQPDQRLDKALVAVFEGVSPLLAREWTYYVCRDGLRTGELTEHYRSRLLFILHETRRMLTEQDCRFSILSTPEGALKDYCFLRPAQYGALMVVRPMPSASAALDEFYAQRDLRARMKQRANDLFKLLMTRIDRTSRKLANQRQELSETDKMEENKLFGDLLSANIYRLEKGDAQAVLENFYAEDCAQVTIPLRTSMTPAQNAQYYYTLYRKAATAKEKLAEQIAQGEAELTYLESVFDVLSRAETESDLLLLREELVQQGYIRSRNTKQKPPKQAPPLLCQSSDGFPILIGRNNRQNDQLTLKEAAKSDLWLHTQNIPGSHVILVTDGREPTETAIREAAMLAAYHSKARDSAQVPVDFTKVKFVKKPAGAKPGMVIFTNQQTLYVRPDAALCTALEAK